MLPTLLSTYARYPLISGGSAAQYLVFQLFLYVENAISLKCETLFYQKLYSEV